MIWTCNAPRSSGAEAGAGPTPHHLALGQHISSIANGGTAAAGLKSTAEAGASPHVRAATTSTPPAPLTDNPVVQRYEALLRSGTLHADPAQVRGRRTRAVRHLAVPSSIVVSGPRAQLTRTRALVAVAGERGTFGSCFQHAFGRCPATCHGRTQHAHVRQLHACLVCHFPIVLSAVHGEPVLPSWVM